MLPGAQLARRTAESVRMTTRRERIKLRHRVKFSTIIAIKSFQWTQLQGEKAHYEGILVSNDGALEAPRLRRTATACWPACIRVRDRRTPTSDRKFMPGSAT